MPIKSRENRFGRKTNIPPLLKIVQRIQVYVVCGKATPYKVRKPE